MIASMRSGNSVFLMTTCNAMGGPELIFGRMNENKARIRQHGGSGLFLVDERAAA